MSNDQGLLDHRLPTYLTQFIGREREITFLRQLMGGDSVATNGLVAPGAQKDRLITLSGVGGCGKTRLALEVARGFAQLGDDDGSSFRDGVRWVDLASVTDPAELPQVVAAALDLREAASLNPLEALVNELNDQHILLIIDNCEHLAAACQRLVKVLIPTCPRVVILLTSRTPLHVADETIFAVPPLQTVIPQHGCFGDDSPRSEATRLFLNRVAMVTPGYTSTGSTAETISHICQRLDGLPLAIELAASWMRVLTARDLLAEIDRSIDFLSSSAPTLAERHRSLRAVLESSWQRLGKQDQQVFSALGVFRGNFSREAAEVVCGASLSSLSALTETYLIQRLPDSESETRYHIHELVRQFAFERLEALDPAQAERARQRHLDYFLSLVERAEEAWDTALEMKWLDRLRTERSNLDAALRWAMDQQQTEEALRLSAGLFTFWVYTSPLALYAAALEQAVSLPWDARSPAITRARAKALNVAGYAAVARSDFRGARTRFDEGLTLFSSLVDDRSIAWSLRGRSFANRLAGDVVASQADEERSLTICRATNDLRGEAWSVHDLGEIAFALDDLDRAEQLLEEGLDRFEEHGVAFGAYRAIILLGDVNRRRTQWSDAITRYEQALARQRQLHFVARGADILEGLAEVAVALHQPTTAARLFGAGHAWRESFGFARYLSHEEDHERSLTAAQGQLRAGRWSTNYDAGRRLNSEQAMDEAHLRARELASGSTGRDLAGLTERELEVLHAVALGLGSSEIAAQLVVSPRTVHAHLRSIFHKLNVSTRTAAVHEAARLNLV